MRKNCMLTLLLIVAMGSYAQRDDLKLFDYWVHYGDMSNNLYKHLCSIAFEQIDERSAYLSGLQTDEARMQYPAEVRKKLEKAMGAFPAKTPLNPVITGRLKRDDFTVEKLYFESLPGYYVTAALFIPTKYKGKKPAILYCCGHSIDGFRSETYQRSIMNFVKKGFVVLAFDPVGQGERVQYFDANGKPLLGDPTHEHSYPGTQSFISGLPPANYFVWDGIRAIDYLVSRKEVDPQRIGVTGRSGGGTQTAYIAAMDNRVTAAAPECYTTTYNRLLRTEGPQDAEQILMHFLAEGLDMNDLIEARAPKATMIVSTTRDYFSIQGAREVFNEAQAIYKAFGKSENLLMSEDDAGHASTLKNREAVTAFFQKHLDNPGDPKEQDVEPFDAKDLWVTPTGQFQQFILSETLFSLNKKYTETLLNNLQEKQKDYSGYINGMRNKVIEMTGYKAPASVKEFIFSGRLWRDGYAIERYLVKGSGNYYIPLLRLCPKAESKETLLLLDEKGKSFAVNEGLAGQLAQRGYEVIVPDLNDIGELGGGFKGGDAIIQNTPLNVWYAGILTNKTPVAVRMEEVGKIIDFIGEITTAEEVIGVACGTLTADLLHAAVVDKRLGKLALVNPLYSYRSIVQEKRYHTKYAMSAIPGVIGEYDLSDLVSVIAPRKVLMLNPCNSLDQKVGSDIFTSVYAKAKERYQALGASNGFSVKENDSDILETIDNWLK